jgi:hypothetical protein
LQSKVLNPKKQNKLQMKRVILFILFQVLIIHLWAQSNFTVSGYVKDSKNEILIGANVTVKETSQGYITNSEGFYSITLPKGEYTLVISYVGYNEKRIPVKLVKNTEISCNLEESYKYLDIVEVQAEAPDKNVRKVEMSTNKLEMKQILKLPVVFGEGDVIKTLQLLPGVSSASEASGGFNVRGGNVDQNLILIDNAQVYNASHSIGFFSVFNSNVINDLKLYKGGIPAEYGGRLSSILDIRTIDADMNKFHGEASVGIISSKLILQGPIWKNKASVFIAGRRTYADLFLPFAKDSLAKESKIYFYDLNSKIKINLGKKDNLYLSAYYGRDVMSLGKEIKQQYGNDAYSARWSHIFGQHFFVNNYFTISKYNYDLEFAQDNDKVRITTSIQDYSFKSVFNLEANERNTIKFGAEFINHDFNPGSLSGKQASVTFNYKIPSCYSREIGMFLQNEASITSKLSLMYGLRYSVFYNIGTGQSFEFDKTNPADYTPVDTTNYTKGQRFNMLPGGIEPRIALRYLTSETNSLKLSYNRMYQYVQLASNSTASIPLDYWFPSSPNIKPQIADQFAAGYFMNFKDNMFEFSLEGFYKNMKNSIDFKDHANLLLNDAYEGQLRTGKSWAYGAELMVKKQKGKLTGWVSYTYSRAFKEIKEINNGKAYAASYDKPHNLAVVVSYDVNSRLNVSGTLVFNSAPPRTMPQQRWEYSNMLAPSYGERNSVRVFPYHRMDLAATYRLNKVEHKWEHSINVSLYNAYAHHNYIMISYIQDPDNKNATKAVGTYLYTFVPSISYTIKF